MRHCCSDLTTNKGLRENHPLGNIGKGLCYSKPTSSMFVGFTIIPASPNYGKLGTCAEADTCADVTHHTAASLTPHPLLAHLLLASPDII